MAIDLKYSEEGRAMMGYSVTENPSDMENNNNNNVKREKSVLNKKEATARSSSKAHAKGVLAQCLVTSAVLLLATGGGIPIGYSAVLLPQLAEENSTLPVDRETGSWIASIHSLATPFGALISGPLLDAMGRRGCLQLSAIPLGVGWLVIGLSRNVTSMLVGRVICGFSVGFMSVPAQVLIGETAYPALRGFLLVGGFAAYCVGILMVYTLGASFRWDIVAFISITLPVVAFVALCLVPESPAWLLKRKKIEEAKKALLWLRGGDNEQMLKEIESLDANIKTDLAKQPVNKNLFKKISSAIATMRDPDVLKPLIIINVFNILQITSGTYIVIFYAVDMINGMGDGNVDNYLAAVVTAVIRFIFCLVSCVLLLKMGRRLLGIISALGTALASLVLAGYLIVKKERSPEDIYVLTVCLVFYVAANSVGLLTLPGLMAGELMPLRARGVGGGLIFFTFNLLLFFLIKCFPAVSNVIGTTGVFITFGISGLLEALFIYLALPETRNCTLEEIEEYFQQSNFLWINRKQMKRRDTHMIAKAESNCLIPLPECK